ncbi:MAG: phage holin family protein [Oscillospiraceae bacterium]|nr:phage holin family protein [Oscillospiraceae bacterium]
MDYFTEYIRAELLILIPVLYFIGIGLKKASFIHDRWIPILLGCTSIVLAAIYVFATSEIHHLQDVAMMLFASITQGILTAGTSVFCNQIYKQAVKGDDDPDTTNKG